MVGHTNSINSICFSLDSTRLASCSDDTTVRLWDAHTGSAIGDAMVGHTNSINSICFSPDGTHLASCSGDATVRLWDAYTGSALGDAMVGHTSLVLSIRFSPDGTCLLSMSDAETLMWETHSMTAVKLSGQTGIPDWVSSIVDVRINDEGWLLVANTRTLWIPDQYRGFSVAGIKGVGGKTVCIGGFTGTLIFLWFPDM
jgi:WD40 repeat protein